MPTSSQALIIYKDDAGSRASHQHLSQTQMTPWTPNRDPAPLATAEIYNLGGCMPFSADGIRDRDAIEALGRDSASVFKHYPLPKGYTSILSFDKDAQAFRWEAIGGADPSDPDGIRHITISSSIEDQTIEPEKTESKQRPLTTDFQWKSASIGHFDKNVYDRLVGLGFRRSTTSTTGHTAAKTYQTASKTYPKAAKTYPTAAKTSSEARTATLKPYTTGFGIKGKSLKGDKKSPEATKITLPYTTGVSRAQSGPMVVIRPQSSFVSRSKLYLRNNRGTKSAKANCHDYGDSDQDQSDISDEYEDIEESSHDGEQLVEEYTRIKPTIYMRKDNPDFRPSGAVLSFRDNECSSHADVKYLIETQLNVRVTSVQYDPLNVRVDRDDVRSRWLIDFKTVQDLETAVKNGLIVGNDHIIIYRFDDLTRRELASFKYFMTIQEAKKKLKSTKSCKTMKAVKSALKARAAKSTKL